MFHHICTIVFFIFLLTWASSIHAACTSGDCQNGYGTFVWPNGNKYVGNWVNGKQKGYGTLTQSGEFGKEEQKKEISNGKIIAMFIFALSIIVAIILVKVISKNKSFFIKIGYLLLFSVFSFGGFTLFEINNELKIAIGRLVLLESNVEQAVLQDENKVIFDLEKKIDHLLSKQKDYELKNDTRMDVREQMLSLMIADFEIIKTSFIKNRN